MSGAPLCIWLDDAELASVQAEGEEVALRFSVAAARRTGGDGRPVEGFLSRVTLRLGGARLALAEGTALAHCQGAVREGRWRSGGQRLAGLPCPGTREGEGVLTLTLRNGAELGIAARALSVAAAPDAVFRESFAC